MRNSMLATLLVLVASTGCSDKQSVAPRGEADQQVQSTAENGGSDSNAKRADTFTWPASIPAFGDGYPTTGDICRRVGESAATVDFLDHTAALIGCPSGEAAAIAQIIGDGGRKVAEMDGVVLISVPEE